MKNVVICPFYENRKIDIVFETKMGRAPQHIDLDGKHIDLDGMKKPQHNVLNFQV